MRGKDNNANAMDVAWVLVQLYWRCYQDINIKGINFLLNVERNNFV